MMIKYFYVSGKYPYDEVLAKSLLFYEAERSGPLPSDNRFCPYKYYYNAGYLSIR